MPIINFIFCKKKKLFKSQKMHCNRSAEFLRKITNLVALLLKEYKELRE